MFNGLDVEGDRSQSPVSSASMDHYEDARAEHFDDPVEQGHGHEATASAATASHSEGSVKVESAVGSSSQQSGAAVAAAERGPHSGRRKEGGQQHGQGQGQQQQGQQRGGKKGEKQQQQQQQGGGQGQQQQAQGQGHNQQQQQQHQQHHQQQQGSKDKSERATASDKYAVRRAQSAGAPSGSPQKDAADAVTYPPQHQVWDTGKTRILVVTDLRGNLSLINELVVETAANYVISTGNFGFFDEESEKSIPNDRLPQSFNYSNSNKFRPKHNPMIPIFGELPQFIRGDKELLVPVYSVWGSHADVRVICKLRSGEYKVKNLHLVDELSTHLLDNVRLFGIGGAIEYNKLLNTGEGTVDAISGARGRMWLSLMQIGQLLRLADSVQSTNKEYRVFLSHLSPLSEGILAKLVMRLKCDVSISSNLTTPIPMSLFESQCHPFEVTREIFRSAGAIVDEIWSEVEGEVAKVCGERELALIRDGVALCRLEPTHDYYDDTWHISNPSVRRSGFTVLVVDANALGMQSSYPGCEFLKKRQVNKVKHQQNMASLRADATLTISSAEGPWNLRVSIYQIRDYFKGQRVELVVNPLTPDDPYHVSFPTPDALAKALRIAGPTLAGVRVRVVPTPSTLAAQAQAQGGQGQGQGQDDTHAGGDADTASKSGAGAEEQGKGKGYPSRGRGGSGASGGGRSRGGIRGRGSNSSGATPSPAPQGGASRQASSSS